MQVTQMSCDSHWILDLGSTDFSGLKGECELFYYQYFFLSIKKVLRRTEIIHQKIAILKEKLKSIA